MKPKTYNFANETAELHALLLGARESVGDHGDRAPQPMFELWTALTHLLSFINWRQTVVVGADGSPPVDKLFAIDATYESARELLQGIEIGRFSAEPEYAASKATEAILIANCAFSLFSVECSWGVFARQLAAKTEAYRALSMATGRVGTCRLQLDAVHAELLRHRDACEIFMQAQTESAQ